ncbi:uncharacterized protein VTP21DRAFT_7526 [Calcarisporiella thermophila]|uniref:uncharacterized protein n=1 Tax=Calcarisporiella thermophila TaxID=911321 RepID=UPI00374272CF
MSSQLPSNPILRFIVWHYTNTSYNRSEKQLEREKHVLGLVPFNRWLLMPAAVLFQLICGSLYAWSVFNKPIDVAIYGADRGMAPTTFYIAVGCFGLAAAITGPWLERNGPRIGAYTGSTLFLLGNLLSAAGIHFKQIGLVYFGYGVVGGTGLGICYISPVSPLQKWFPDHRGLASGLAVCGFGAGSIALAKVPLPLQALVGLPLTFVILGCIYFVVMIACSVVFRVPPPGFTVNGMDISGRSAANKWDNSDNKEQMVGDEEKKDPEAQVVSIAPEPTISMTLIESIFSREYRLMYIMFFGNSIAGLVFISRLSNIISDIFGKGKDEAATIVSINGGFNLAGRLLFSAVSDYVGRKTCFVFMLTVQVIILGSLSTTMFTQAYWAHNIIVWILTSCYGAGFGIIPAFLTDMFGPSNIGALHGIILTAWAIAGVGGGLVFTAVYNSLIASGQYTANSVEVYSINLWWIFAVALVGFLFLLLIRTSVRDRLMPPAEGEILRIRFFGQLIRLRKSGVEVVSKKKENEEWEEFYMQQKN